MRRSGIGRRQRLSASDEMSKLHIEEVNALDYEDFIERFKGVVEHGTLVAGAVWSYHPFQSLDHLHQCFCDFIDSLNEHGKHSILRCHPNLAGRLAQEGRLTEESQREQSGAGLMSLTADQHAKINEYNDIYRSKFSFPFVICARENKFAAILSGLSSRVQNSEELELVKGIEEVKKISYYRLLDLVEDGKEFQPKL